jgi:hypothetical protein
MATLKIKEVFEESDKKEKEIAILSLLRGEIAINHVTGEAYFFERSKALDWIFVGGSAAASHIKGYWFPMAGARTSREIAKLLNVPRQAVVKRLKRLAKRGRVDVGMRGKKKVYSSTV